MGEFFEAPFGSMVNISGGTVDDDIEVNSGASSRCFDGSRSSIFEIFSCALLNIRIGFSFLADGRWGRMAADELVVIVECH